jgi:hypothetical protein
MGPTKIEQREKENTKKINETRCSAKADVILELKEGYDGIKKAAAEHESLMQRLTHNH